MHFSALENAKRFFETYTSSSSLSQKVLDIGSLNVNGSIKDVCPSNIQYTGADFTPGKGVDVILEDPYQLPFENQSFDFVVSSSCYEHSEFFWLSFLEALRITKDNGLMYINAPSNAAFHRYPVDCWRFYPDSGSALVNWANRNGSNCLLLESYITNQNKGRVNDFVAVILKNKDHLNLYPTRIIDQFTDFTNGKTNKSEELINQEWETEDHRKYPYIERFKRIRRSFKSRIISLLK